jgi:SAM-dependent methyltransferase
MPRAWYREAFGRHYLEVYAHRNDASARREVEFAAAALDLATGDRVLDLACGAGRHSRALAALDLKVTSVDLSPELVSSAAATGGGPEYVRGDMRALPFSGPFEAVCQFFTSFGYFENSAEDEAVLGEVRRVLRPGGRYLFDYLNAGQVVAGLVPESTEELGAFTIHQRRRITADGTRVEKDVVIREGEILRSEYTESVRLYDQDDIRGMMSRSGLVPLVWFGDLAGAPFQSDSPRLVVVARC